MHLADTLSRAYLPFPGKEDDVEYGPVLTNI